MFGPTAGVGGGTGHTHFAANAGAT